jgi:undecaprenyl-diphosphatase
MDYLQAILIAIVEGLTEYLPVSSTAHMIFTSSFFGIQEDEFVKLFQVSIQFGAISYSPNRFLITISLTSHWTDS